VIIFYDNEFFRPVRDDMLVENDVTNYLRPVRDAMLVMLMMESWFHQHFVPNGTAFSICIVFYQHLVPNGTEK
jgi:hypothetical protein